MSNTERTHGLIQRAAERLRNTEAPLIEKAARRLADDDTEVLARPAPTPTVTPQDSPLVSPAKSPSAARAKSPSAAPANGAGLASGQPQPGNGTGTPAASGSGLLPPDLVESPPEPAPGPTAATTSLPEQPVMPEHDDDDDERPHRVDIDLMRLQLAGYVTPNGERKRIIEEYRIIKRPLLNRAISPDEQIRNGNLVMVTSARPKDGKTFTAINLAMSMASERDLNILLVDADMYNQVRNDSLMAALGVHVNEGLLDVLANPDMDLADVLIRTNIPNLSLMTAGSFTTNPNELLASNRMGDVVNEMAKRYSDRVIIFDTPPVLATSEASVLAMHVGQILFVVEADKTSHKAVDSSLSLLSACQNISLVLNKANLESGADRFGSYSYY